jgi:protein-L-isoaspartate(D-aspartate) O-methyltransferase
MAAPHAAVIVSANGFFIVSDAGNGKRNTTASLNFEEARKDMVARQIRDRGIHSARVLEAMQRVPRHLFVPPEHIGAAYADEPLPIGEGQTISQPFMVAAMSEALGLEGHERVLEVGAGSGYQSAILSLLARDVTGIESQPALAASARERLSRLGFPNVRIIGGDGSAGWAQGAPYDAILVAAAAPGIPPPLVDQLAEGGHLVIPVGPPEQQDLIRVMKIGGRTTKESLYSCRFVPLLGEFGWAKTKLEITSR